PRALLGLGLWGRALRQALEHDRLREALEPDARPRPRGLRRRPRRRGREAERHGADPRLQPGPGVTASSPIRLGLRANAAQFALLVVVNAFVGAMVGMERSILPALAQGEFHLAARGAILSFIVVFGIS